MQGDLPASFPPRLRRGAEAVGHAECVHWKQKQPGMGDACGHLVSRSGSGTLMLLQPLTL